MNHAVATRPTGSIFKPFVYAAAYNTTIAGTTLPGQDKLFTAVTMLNDEQTTYEVPGSQEYTPRNYNGEYHGMVTARVCAGAFAEQRNHQPGCGSRVRQRGSIGARGGHQASAGNAVGGHRLL